MNEWYASCSIIIWRKPSYWSQVTNELVFAKIPLAATVHTPLWKAQWKPAVSDNKIKIKQKPAARYLDKQDESEGDIPSKNLFGSDYSVSEKGTAGMPFTSLRTQHKSSQIERRSWKDQCNYMKKR